MTVHVLDWGHVAPLDYTPELITPQRFEIWLRTAVVGVRLVYAVASNLGRDGRDSALPGLVRDAYRAGLVHLVQRRVGPMRLEYIAVRRNPPARTPLRMIGDAPVADDGPQRRLNVVRHEHLPCRVAAHPLKIAA